MNEASENVTLHIEDLPKQMQENNDLEITYLSFGLERLSVPMVEDIEMTRSEHIVVSLLGPVKMVMGVKGISISILVLTIAMV